MDSFERSMKRGTLKMAENFINEERKSAVVRIEDTESPQEKTEKPTAWVKATKKETNGPTRQAQRSMFMTSSRMDSGEETGELSVSFLVSQLLEGKNHIVEDYLNTLDVEDRRKVVDAMNDELANQASNGH